MANDDDKLLDELYALSGESTRTPTADQYSLVLKSLKHSREYVLERAIFIGGLRWMDELILSYFKGVLISGDHEADDNRRLMIEALVSESLIRGDEGDRLKRLLEGLMRTYSSNSLAAKAAYVGIKRLRGEISKSEFAVLDYDDIDIGDKGP